jgi:hypothetical protein
VRGLVTRELSPGFVAGLLGFVFVLLPLMVLIGTETSIGQRLVDHLYYDDSAQARQVEWRVLHYLSTHDLLFGVPLDRVTILKAQIGLAAADTDIENPWLLLFLNLGAIGFVIFLAALLLFFSHLLRNAPPAGWLLLIAMVVIDSTSNSLGRKTDDLCYLAACMIAVSAFARRPVEAAAEPERRRAPPPRPRDRAMSPSAAPAGSGRSLAPLPLARRSLSLLAGDSAR